MAPAVDPPVGQLVQSPETAMLDVHVGEYVLARQPVHVLPSPYSPSLHEEVAKMCNTLSLGQGSSLGGRSAGLFITLLGQNCDTLTLCSTHFKPNTTLIVG